MTTILWPPSSSIVSTKYSIFPYFLNYFLHTAHICLVKGVNSHQVSAC